MSEDDRVAKHDLCYQASCEGSRFIDFVWEIHFCCQNAEIKLWMWKWTSHNLTWGCFCVLCVIWAQFVDGLGEFLVRCCSQRCFSNKGRGVTTDKWVPQFNLVSQSNGENCHKNTTFIKFISPIISASYSAFTVIAWYFWSEKIHKNILVSAICLCAGLLDTAGRQSVVMLAYVWLLF